VVGGIKMKLKRILCVLLAVCMMLSNVGCQGENGSKTSGSNLTVWYEPSSVKILQDDYGVMEKTAVDKRTLKINMARNESEGTQMMMYAKKDIASYEVSVSDLTNGEHIISKDAIDIYQVKYMLKEEGLYSDGNPDYPAGSYIPDPLLPFETAVKYEENVIDKGKNQAIYFDVTTTEETPAGVYTGVVTTIVGRETYELPMEVTVYDVVYPDTAKLKTAFSIFLRDTITPGELECSDEMTETYFETLLDYNMSCALPFEGEGGVTKYLELLKKYYNYPGFSSYRLYYELGRGYDGEKGSFNGDLFEEYLVGIADMSVSDGVNYLEKAYFYGYNIIDEPKTADQFLIAHNLQEYIKKILRTTDWKLRTKYSGTEEFEYYDTVVSETLLSLPYVLPGAYSVEEAENGGMEDFVYVPLISKLDYEYERDGYQMGSVDKELWTYTCVEPKYPYPSAHIDDSSLGFRLTSWMCFDYDIDAFLMWATNQYVDGANGEVNGSPWTDMNVGFERPGDGRYFYPGEAYGLDEPCPSLRAMQYRDGVDDYSLLQAFEDIYGKYNVSTDSVLSESFEKLYRGTVPTTVCYLFEEVRVDLFNKLEELQSDTAVVYVDKEIQLGNACVQLFTVNEDAEIYREGQKAQKNENGIYLFDVNIIETSELCFTVKCGKEEKEHTYRIMNGKLGVAYDFESVESVESLIKSTTAGYQANISADIAQSGSQSLHVTMNEEKTDTIPYFSILENSALVEGNWDNLKNIQFMAYNAGAEDISVSFTYYITGEVTIETFTLPAGEWMKVELSMPEDVDLSTIGEYNFNFDRGSSVNLYIDDFLAFVEGE